MYRLVLYDVGGLAVHLVLVDSDGDLCVCHADGIVGRVEAYHLLTRFIGEGIAMASVIVSEEHQVEAWHFLCHTLRCILLILSGFDTAILAAMEETDDHVWVFVVLDVFHPFLGTRHHVLEAQSAPKVLCQPVGDGWGQHAEHCHLHALTLQDDVRFHVRLAGLRFDDVGTEHRTVEFLDPFVVNGMSRFNIVITKGLCVILQVVDHICRHVAFVGGDVVVIVASWLTLQDVAVLQQDQVVLVAQSEGVHVGGHTS